MSSPSSSAIQSTCATFRQLVEEGRLGLVGGTDTMLDVNMPGGESFARQALFGKRFFRDKLGVDIKIGWQLDTFGHNAQMPQLLKQAGFEHFWFFRGVPGWETTTELLWEGLDGTQIKANWLAQGYAIGYGAPHTLEEFIKFVDAREDLLSQNTRSNFLLAAAGADVCEPEPHLADLVAQYNARPDRRMDVYLVTPQEFETLTADVEREVLKGELNPVFQGIYSSRIRLKQWTRALEQTLLTGEKLGVLLDVAGLHTCDAPLEAAWEPMLFNQAHDLMSGVMTDQVWEDAIRAFDFGKQVAGEQLADRLRAYCDKVDTRGEGTPVVVFNALSWARTDIVRARVGFSQTGYQGVKVLDPDGEELPAQIVSVRRHLDGSLLEVEVAFLAKDVPALGHSLYRILPTLEPVGLGKTTDNLADAVLENTLLRAEVAAGALRSLKLKSSDWEALSGPANVIIKEDDHGDLWEPYKPLDGGSRIAMTEQHPAPPRATSTYSDESPLEGVQLTTGPVFTEFSFEQPFGQEERLKLTLRLFEGLPRLECHTELLNNSKFVRYRASFPTSITAGTNTQEIPYGAIERPVGVEYPAQNWLDWSDESHGVALLNRGLPGNNVADGNLLLSLARTTAIVAYGFGGGYEPGMSSDSGFELGQQLAFDYALAPHEGDWREAQLWRQGLEFNTPLIALTAAVHEGPLPAVWGLLKISAANVVVSSLKRSQENDFVLRLYEAAGQPAEQVEISLPHGIYRAFESNLIEDCGAALHVEGGKLTLSLRPFEVKTIRLAQPREDRSE